MGRGRHGNCHRQSPRWLIYQGRNRTSEGHRWPPITAVVRLSLWPLYVRVSLQAQSHLQSLGSQPSSAMSAPQPVDPGTRPALDISGVQSSSTTGSPHHPACPTSLSNPGSILQCSSIHASCPLQKADLSHNPDPSGTIQP